MKVESRRQWMAKLKRRDAHVSTNVGSLLRNFRTEKLTHRSQVRSETTQPKFARGQSPRLRCSCRVIGRSSGQRAVVIAGLLVGRHLASEQKEGDIPEQHAQGGMPCAAGLIWDIACYSYVYACGTRRCVMAHSKLRPADGYRDSWQLSYKSPRRRGYHRLARFFSGPRSSSSSLRSA